jgi:hypothetical protein
MGDINSDFAGTNFQRPSECDITTKTNDSQKWQFSSWCQQPDPNPSCRIALTCHNRVPSPVQCSHQSPKHVKVKFSFKITAIEILNALNLNSS